MRHLGLIVAVILSCVGIAAAGEEGSQAKYYRRYSGYYSTLLELKSDSTYRMINRHHFRLDDVDQGHWRNKGEYELELVSDKFCKSIKSGPFSIAYVTTETLNLMPTMRAAADDLIIGMTGETITGREAGVILDRRLPTYPFEINVSSERLYATDAKPITKGEVEELRRVLREAVVEATSVTATFNRRTHRSVAYLDIPAIDERPWAGMASISEGDSIAKSAMKNAPEKDRIRDLFVEITAAEFERESTSFQEYLYQPDLEKGIRTSARKRSKEDGERPDPALDPVGALKAIVPSFQVVTSAPATIAGVYGQPGKSLGGGLSGDILYLFPDQSYFYLEWADIAPPHIVSRGTWSTSKEYVALNDDGSLKPKYRGLSDTAFLPVRFIYNNQEVVGMLGFPDSYESIFSWGELSDQRILIQFHEASKSMGPEWKQLKETLMRKHWRPDYVSGKEGAKFPEW